MRVHWPRPALDRECVRVCGCVYLQHASLSLLLSAFVPVCLCVRVVVACLGFVGIDILLCRYGLLAIL